MSKNIPGYVSLTVHELGIIEYVAGEEAPRNKFRSHQQGGGAGGGRGSRRGKRRNGGGGGGNPNFMNRDRAGNQPDYDNEQPGQDMSRQPQRSSSEPGFRLPRGKFRGQSPNQPDSNSQPVASSELTEA